MPNYSATNYIRECLTFHVIYYKVSTSLNPFSALTLLVGRQEGHPACKKLEWWGTGMVICLEQGADLHKAQLMPLPLTVSWFSKIQIGFTFLVPAHPGSPGKRAIKWACVCVLNFIRVRCAKMPLVILKQAILKQLFEFITPSLCQSDQLNYIGH